MAYPSDILFPAIDQHVISVLSRQSVGDALAAGAVAAPASAVWPLANRAYYIPFVVTAPSTVKHMFWVNGTTPAGQADIGIYTEAGTQLVAIGATGTSGATRTQGVNITDTVLMPGRYYMGFSQSSGGDVMLVTAAGFDLATLGVYIQASAYPLPATATFATAINLFTLPVCGLTLEAVV